MLGWNHVKQLEKCSPLISSAFKRYVSQSYYDILKVSQTCSSKDVRDAFINLSKQNHPDKHGNDPSMHERFVQINEAYSVLINPSTRRQYDMTLGSKRKLNAPHDVYTTRTTNPHKPNSQTKKQTGSSSYSSSSGGSTSQDYFYTSWEKRTEDHRDNYYGIKGIKRVSNWKILFIIIGFTCVGGTLQWLAIRAYSKSTREKMMENSRRLGLIHAMAREKARLYGNEYQINILKNTLKTTYDVEPSIDVVAEVPDSPEPVVIDLGHETCGKCKKCKKL
ncbi:hypothetical protein GE061_012378 [Apolygus lucorum]|uniref:Uncharacterized protein n=1 Tax=Apolygus lucorum TaxID=248454 RepID=A0A6A4JIF5_APOLU|nr:hypothetical protein GE061_012378 [Apolygus lucorum]